MNCRNHTTNFWRKAKIHRSLYTNKFKISRPSRSIFGINTKRRRRILKPISVTLLSSSTTILNTTSLPTMSTNKFRKSKNCSRKLSKRKLNSSPGSLNTIRDNSRSAREEIRSLSRVSAFFRRRIGRGRRKKKGSP